MNDLASLMRIAPTTAASFMGTNQAQEEQMANARRMELEQLMQQRQQTAQFNAAKQPFELEQLRLGNATTAAQLPGIQGDSALKQTNATKAAGTLQTDIDAGNTANVAKALTTVSTSLGNMSGALDNVSDIEKPRKFQELVSSLDMPPQMKQLIMQRYSTVSPAELQATMQADARRIMQNTPAFQQATEVQRMQNAGELERTQLTSKTQKEIEAARIAAGKYDRRKQIGDVTQQLDGMVQAALKKGARSGHAAALAAAEMANRANLPELAAKYTAVAEQIRNQAEAEISNLTPVPGKVDPSALTGGSIPVNPSKSIAPGGAQKPAGGRISVIGPNGKRGTIPAEQLEQALSQGYKKAQ